MKRLPNHNFYEPIKVDKQLITHKVHEFQGMNRYVEEATREAYGRSAVDYDWANEQNEMAKVVSQKLNEDETTHQQLSLPLESIVKVNPPEGLIKEEVICTSCLEVMQKAYLLACCSSSICKRCLLLQQREDCEEVKCNLCNQET
jgi:hypothetical protein